MTKKTKKALAIGGGVVAVGIVGYLVYKAKSTPASLPPNPAATTNVTVSPGVNSQVSLTAAHQGTLSVMAPTGATLGTVTINPAGVLVPASNGIMYDYVAAKAGNATVVVNYTDPSGHPQAATIPVVVS